MSKENVNVLNTHSAIHNADLFLGIYILKLEVPDTTTEKIKIMT